MRIESFKSVNAGTLERYRWKAEKKKGQSFWTKFLFEKHDNIDLFLQDISETAHAGDLILNIGYPVKIYDGEIKLFGWLEPNSCKGTMSMIKEEWIWRKQE